MAQEEQEGVYSKVNEPTVHFKLITDRIIREINNPEINQTVNTYFWI